MFSGELTGLVKLTVGARLVVDRGVIEVKVHV
jgi:hypothetical protein